MGFYEEQILPHLIHWACSSDIATHQRKKVVPLASGNVLEIGAGSGLNVPYYDPARVEKVWLLEPSAALRKKAGSIGADLPFPVEWLPAAAEAIPLPDEVVDTVLVTYTLCSIEDVETALQEMHRVLKPGGKFLFCEHGRAPEPRVAQWQSRLTPYWKRISGGCHLDRDIPTLLGKAGFRIKHLEQTYLPGWKLFTYHYWGEAIKNNR